MQPGTGIGTAIASPLLDSHQVGRKYSYRYRMGMVPSAEFAVFQDDFVTPVHSGSAVTNGFVQYQPEYGWKGIILDSGTTITVNTTAATGAHGVLSVTDATASEGAAVYGEKCWQLTSGKRLFVEVRGYTDDVSDNDLQFGLSDQTATTNPEDLWTTTAANLVTFGILDGSAYPQMLSDKSNGGTTVQTQTVKALTASQWFTMAIFYDGAQLQAFVDGDRVLTWSGAATTIPTGTALGLFFGARNGNGAGGNTQLFDYIRVVSER